MGLPRILLTLVITVSVVAAGGGYWAYSSGALEKPSAGVEDMGDWGEVSESETQVITSIWVENPNPVGINIGRSVSAAYRIDLNGVRLAEGQQEGISVQSGNNTVPITTNLKNDNIASWWVNFIQNNETLYARGQGEVQINAPVLSGSYQPAPVEKRMLQDETPVITSISNAVQAIEGRYTVNEIIKVGPVEEESTVGWEIRDAHATWGEVNQDQTTVVIHLQVHNPSERVPVPAIPDGLGLSVGMNDVKMFEAQSGAFSPQSVSTDAVINPGETREFALELSMDNDRVDEWFTSHVREDEHTTIETQFQLVFEAPKTGITLRVPQEGGVRYACEMQTGILKDNQANSTTCGENGTLTVG